jgi:hypothetical protein
MAVSTRSLRPLARQQRNIIREISLSLILLGALSAFIIAAAHAPSIAVAAAVSSAASFGAAFLLVRTRRTGIVWWLFVLQLALGVAALLGSGTFVNALVLFLVAGYTLHRALRLDEITDRLQQFHD